jgi:hypothetical protein
MKSSRLVMGLYDLADPSTDRQIRARLRDLSLSWARFGYQGPVIEGDDPQSILDEAIERKHEYCLILAAGTLFDENWYPAHWGRRDAHSQLSALMENGDFLAAGRLRGAPGGGIVVDDRCLLVNLRRYASCERPRLSAAFVRAIDGEGSAPGPTSSASCWLIEGAQGDYRATFRRFDLATSAAIVDLVSPTGNADAVAPYLSQGIHEYQGFEENAFRDQSQRTGQLLAKVKGQVEGAKRGVFPWNLESYADVDDAPEGLDGPLSAVYGVAAGFKPYRILKTHGFDATTRLVLFDYSPRALEFRERLLAEWDGADYPAFLREAFRAMPADTYFQLWADLSPAQVADADLEQLWQAEIARWGDAATFQRHWALCRKLPHEFVVCDLLETPERLLERIRPEPRAAVWWSNAFFTIYSNWHFRIAERRLRYTRFINGLAAAAPEIFLYGADHLNSSVNATRARQYAAHLADAARDNAGELTPAGFHRLQIRS